MLIIETWKIQIIKSYPVVIASLIQIIWSDKKSVALANPNDLPYPDSLLS